MSRAVDVIAWLDKREDYFELEPCVWCNLPMAEHFHAEAPFHSDDCRNKRDRALGDGRRQREAKARALAKRAARRTPAQGALDVAS